ncbi:MAG: Gfo/Idh/MocA family oxidoreductase [Gemmataceae bacterium]|nr:Gfo/Idh/MocA family oxidoreductase [Gemmataceae bacterium]
MPLRLAMLGMWHTHADGIVRQVVEHPKEFSLVGFYDRDAKVVAQRVKQWEPRLGKLRVFDKPETLLKEGHDGVVVEGRVHENLRLARLALDHAKPVLLEKPAGDNFDEYRRLIDQAQKKHLHVQMIYLFRYMSAVQEMLQRVRKNELGRIYHFRARLPKDLPSYKRYVEELAEYKGGMFFEMAGHVIDMMVAMLGTPRRITPFMAHHHREGPAGFIDNGVAVFEYPNAWASVEVPTLEVAPHSRRLEVFGTEGALVIPHLGSGHLANKNLQPVELYRRGQAEWQTLALTARTLQISDLREFASVVAGKKRPDFSMDHDLVVQETLLRASGMLAVKRG